MCGRPTQLRQHDVRVLLDEQRVARAAKDVQRDLIRHRRGRQEDRLLVSKELGPSPLEFVDGRVLALLLVAYGGVRDRVTHRPCRLGQGVGAEIDHGAYFAVLNPSPTRVIVHDPLSADDRVGRCGDA